MKTGDVVISKKGKYDGQYFFVIGVEEGFALIADGKTRKADHPKRKNISHLDVTGYSSSPVAERLKSGKNAIDALMRAELKRLKLMLQ